MYDTGVWYSMKRTIEEWRREWINVSKRMEQEYGHKGSLTCVCGFVFNPHRITIEHYDHDDGYEVEGYDKRQWLYITCPRCNYQMALWKLGVKRD